MLENTIYDTEKKCVYGRCDHIKEQDDSIYTEFGKDPHKHGSCFHITQEELADKPTNKKFCPCGLLDGKNVRLFADLGFMEPEPNDFMVTKTCTKCGEEKLINTYSKECNFCRNHSYW